jgi:hypothetical protein
MIYTAPRIYLAIGVAYIGSGVKDGRHCRNFSEFISSY